ncbi:MAG: hypothetical protein HUK02_07180 [Bacteroidaceae bacterium]|nr:hypothetical protein [Bacteroidaceae bacterium]
MLSSILDSKLLEVEECSRTCRFFALLMSLSLLWQVAGFMFWFPFPQDLYYAAVALCFLYIIVGGIRFDIRFLLFTIVLGLNAFLVSTNPVFSASTRFLFFALVLVVASPLIKTKRASLFRQHVFKYTFIGLLPMVVGSFLCFFIGVNFMPYFRLVGGEVYQEYLTDYESVGGVFSGLFTHSMILGLVAALWSAVLFIRYQQKSNIYSLLLFLVAASASLLAASRSAVLALMVAIFYTVYAIKETRDTKKLIIYGGLCMLAMMPVSDRILQGIVNKHEARIEASGGRINSREEQMMGRWEEFVSSPLWGIGFASVASKHAVGADGQIEPGISHLTVLSMTGIIGFLAYLSILVYAVKGVRNKPHPRAQVLMALFIVFFVHMWFEGYIFGAGAYSCFLFWLTISQCFDYRQLEDNEDSFLYEHVE